MILFSLKTKSKTYNYVKNSKLYSPGIQADFFQYNNYRKNVQLHKTNTVLFRQVLFSIIIKEKIYNYVVHTLICILLVFTMTLCSIITHEKIHRYIFISEMYPPGIRADFTW